MKCHCIYFYSYEPISCTSKGFCIVGSHRLREIIISILINSLNKSFYGWVVVETQHIWGIYFLYSEFSTSEFWLLSPWEITLFHCILWYKKIHLCSVLNTLRISLTLYFSNLSQRYLKLQVETQQHIHPSDSIYYSFHTSQWLIGNMASEYKMVLDTKFFAIKTWWH